MPDTVACLRVPADDDEGTRHGMIKVMCFVCLHHVYAPLDSYEDADELLCVECVVGRLVESMEGE